MEQDLEGVKYYKEILKQAVAVSSLLRAKTKNQVLDFKDKLQEYINLLNEYAAGETPMTGAGDEVLEVAASRDRIDFLHGELESIGREILKDIGIAKNTFEKPLPTDRS